MKNKFVIAKIEHIGLHPRLGSGQTIPINLLLRYGKCDFENESIFNTENETIIENGLSGMDMRYQDYIYNHETELFEEV